MSLEMLVAIGAVAVTVLITSFVLYKKLPKRLNQDKYLKRWRELQTLCKDKSLWRDAIISADKLLDRALRQKKFKGKTPGERLVSAQRKLTKNDEVWNAHSLYKKLINDEKLTPKEEDTKKSLSAFRQALRDIGALPSEK